MSLERAEQLSGDTNFIDWTTMKVTKVNRTRLLVGKPIYHVPLDDSYFMEGSLYKNQGGQYRLTPFKVMRVGFCTLMSNEKFFVKDLSKSSELPYPVPCPLPSVGLFLFVYKSIIEFQQCVGYLRNFWIPAKDF